MELWTSLCLVEQEHLDEAADLVGCNLPIERPCTRSVAAAFSHLFPFLTDTLTKQAEDADEDTYNLHMAGQICLTCISNRFRMLLSLSWSLTYMLISNMRIGGCAIELSLHWPIHCWICTCSSKHAVRWTCHGSRYCSSLYLQNFPSAYWIRPDGYLPNSAANSLCKVRARTALPGKLVQHFTTW